MKCCSLFVGVKTDGCPFLCGDWTVLPWGRLCWSNKVPPSQKVITCIVSDGNVKLYLISWMHQSCQSQHCRGMTEFFTGTCVGDQQRTSSGLYVYSGVSYLFLHWLFSFPCPLFLLFPLAHRAAEEAMISDLDENNPGTEWERVARLCDFNPKSSKQAKDVSRMRSVLISLKQSPLVR